MSQHAGDSTPPLTDGTKQKPKSNRTNTAIEISTMTLQVLKEAGDVSPFPGAGAIASLALEILTAVQNARENKDALKRLAYDAVAVATAVVEQFEEIKKKEQTVPSSLEKHTETLKSTMEVIREFTDSQRKRNRLQRIMSSKSDATLIQDYRQQLQQAMGLFGVQSNIDISLALERVEQLLLQQKISDFTESTVESPTAAPLLHTDASNTTTLPSSETPVTEDTTPTSNGAPKPSGCPSPSEFLIGESPAPCDTPSASGTSVPSENFIPSEIPIPSETSTPRASHNPFVHRNSGVSPRQPPTSSGSFSPTMFFNSSGSSISGNVTFNAVSGSQNVTTNNINNQNVNTGNVYHMGRTMSFPPPYGFNSGFYSEVPRRHSTMPQPDVRDPRYRSNFMPVAERYPQRHLTMVQPGFEEDSGYDSSEGITP